MATGIIQRHHRRCPSRTGGKCGKPCVPTYQAWVWSPRDETKIVKTFPTVAAARSWRSDALSAVQKAPGKRTLRDEAVEWLEKAKAGEILTRSQTRYKPAVLRGIEAEPQDVRTGRSRRA